MNHPVAALGILALSMLLLSTLFGDVQSEIEDPRSFQPNDFLIDAVSRVDPNDLPALDNPNIDLSNIRFPDGMELELPEGTIIDGDMIELIEDMELTLPKGTVLEDFEMTLPEEMGFDIPPGTRVEGNELVFPPGTVLEFDDGTKLPLPDGGRMSFPGMSEAELRRAVDSGHMQAPAGSTLNAPRVVSPGDWPMTLPAGTRFRMPYPGYLPDGALDEDTRYYTPPRSSAARPDDEYHDAYGDPTWYEGSDGTGTGGGGSGTGTGGTGGTGSSDDPPAPVEYDREATTDTEITDWSDTIRKGQPFEVRGWVHRADGSGLPNAPVRVFVNATKATPGDQIGTGSTDANGDFIVTATFPTDLEADTYQLVAQHRGLVTDRTYWLVSWSDPPIRVTDGSLLELKVPNPIGLGTDTSLQAVLTDLHGVPVPGAAVRFHIEDQPNVDRTLRTDAHGIATLEHAWNQGGSSTVTARFNGDDHHDPSEARTTVSIVSLAFQPHADDTPRTPRGMTLLVEGTLLDNHEPRPYGTVEYLDPSGRQRTARADATGELTLQLNIPADHPLGRHQVYLQLYADDTSRDRFRGFGATAEVTYAYLVTTPVTFTYDDDAGIARDKAGDDSVASTIPETFEDGRRLQGFTDGARQETTTDQSTGYHQDGHDPRIGARLVDDRRRPLAQVPVTVERVSDGTTTAARTDSKGELTLHLEALDGTDTTFAIRIAESDHWDAYQINHQTTPVVLQATTEAKLVRGVQNDVRITIAATTPGGTPLPDVANGRPAGLDTLNVRFNSTTTDDAPWNDNTPVFQIRPDPNTPPGGYLLHLTTPIPGPDLALPIDIKIQTLLEFEGFPRDYRDDTVLAVAVRAVDDLGRPRVGEAVRLIVENQDTSQTLEQTSDGDGLVTFNVSTSLLSGALTFTASIDGAGDLAPASTTRTLGAAATWIIPTAISLGALLVVGTLAVLYVRQRRGDGRGAITLDPRPQPRLSLHIDDRPAGLPLALAPGESATLHFTVLAHPSTRRSMDTMVDAEGDRADHEADVTANARITVRIDGETIDATHEGATATVRLGPYPTARPLELEVTVAAVRRHRTLTETHRLRVAEWQDQFRFDHDDVVDAARHAQPGMPPGCTPRQLVDTIRRDLPRVAKGIDLDAWVLRLEHAGYGQRDADAKTWVPYASRAKRIQERLQRTKYNAATKTEHPATRRHEPDPGWSFVEPETVRQPRRARRTRTTRSDHA